VNGRVDDVKTEYSRDHVPIHESLLEVLLAWSEQCPQTEEGWMFPNPLSGKPYYSTEIQKRYLKPAGIKLGLGMSARAKIDHRTSRKRSFAAE